MEDTNRRRSKRIRLKGFSYHGCYRYFITVRCIDKRAYFVNKRVVADVLISLAETADREKFHVWAYCFMPDHLHLLIEGTTEESDMRRFITAFKQETAYRYRRRHKEKLWQANYYERVLRKEETTTAVTRYIVENPVRKGIVNSYELYPFSGSLEISDLGQIL